MLGMDDLRPLHVPGNNLRSLNGNEVMRLREYGLRASARFGELTPVFAGLVGEFRNKKKRHLIARLALLAAPLFMVR
jgi:hypothetical protein